MTLSEFRDKRKNINRTHTAPKGLSASEKVRYHSKIAFGWIGDLNDVSDIKTASQEERELTAKALA